MSIGEILLLTFIIIFATIVIAIAYGFDKSQENIKMNTKDEVYSPLEEKIKNEWNKFTLDNKDSSNCYINNVSGIYDIGNSSSSYNIISDSGFYYLNNLSNLTSKFLQTYCQKEKEEKNKIIYIRKTTTNDLIDVAYSNLEAQEKIKEFTKELSEDTKRMVQKVYDISEDDFFYTEYLDDNKKFLISLKNDKAEGLIPFLVVKNESDAKSFCDFKNEKIMEGNSWTYKEIDCN